MPERNPVRTGIYGDFARAVRREPQANKNYANALTRLSQLVVSNAINLTSADADVRSGTRSSIVKIAIANITKPDQQPEVNMHPTGLPSLVAEHLGDIAELKSNLPDEVKVETRQRLYNRYRLLEQLAEYSGAMKTAIGDVNKILSAAADALSSMVNGLIPKPSDLPIT